MKIYILIIFILGSFFYVTGCKDPSTDANALAKKYCNCMEANGANKDYYNAKAICDSKLILENKYFKIQYIEATYGRYMGTLDKKTQVRTNEFEHTFFMSVCDHCKYIYKMDSIREDYLKKQKY